MVAALKTIGLVSTGSELVSGEILDTNGQYFAKNLSAAGMMVGERLLVSDEQTAIEGAIDYILKKNSAVIVCGGLGPTSDDRTRFALADALRRPLFFDEVSWEYICKRLASFNISAHADNKRQAFFPEGAEVLKNKNGTAPGCQIREKDKLIFMLPGPPKECRPMFDQYVLPCLQDNDFSCDVRLKVFKFIGVIEADIASDLDFLSKKLGLETAYRWNYPYLDIKVRAFKKQAAEFSEFSSFIERKYGNYLASSNEKNAVELLRAFFSNHALSIHLLDNLTNGCFHKTFSSVEGVDFVESVEADFLIESRGFDELAKDKTYSGEAALQCVISHRGVKKEKMIKIPRRGQEMYDCAFHFMCFAVCSLLESYFY